MNHFTTPDFWDRYNSLPGEVRELADKNYALLTADPMHPSLHFKRTKDDVWSVRVGRHYRAVAFEEEDGYYWFWHRCSRGVRSSPRTDVRRPPVSPAHTLYSP